MIYYLPIEPYETRYTADWIRQFENEFKTNGVEFKTVYGKSQSKTTGKDPLDATGTSMWKTSQMYELIKLISDGHVGDGDKVLFADIWFPGLQNLFYVRDILGLKVGVYGILHAGCYDINDFTYRHGMSKWGNDFEKSVLNGVDGIFVATNYHKKLIESLYGVHDNIITTGIPFYADELQKYNQPKDDKLVLFPHRNAPEKNPQLFQQLKNELGPDYQCVTTMDVCRSRDDYFSLLGKARYVVSFAEQETFGYSMLEAISLGATVFVPDGLSYKETIPERFRYNCSLEEAPRYIASKIKEGCKENDSGCSYVWKDSIKNMIDILNYSED